MSNTTIWLQSHCRGYSAYDKCTCNHIYFMHWENGACLLCDCEKFELVEDES